MAEIISGLVGGLFGTLVGKVLGKFRLWKVFVVTLVILYIGAFLMGVVLVGFKKVLPIFSELFAPTPLLVFVWLFVSATFVAYLGRNATKKMKDGEEN
ncbi:hypothetical protein K7N18_26200 [Burkholderia arboris]|uniref:hypothetical protein n=1 Tax=Burkholderia arboris TaxID=488730 RepID=UPI001CA3A97A|nr:hypothetical protein [Burkholderia arboris]MBY8608323.1 hypothetical protein [Burkholderia arboris]